MYDDTEVENKMAHNSTFQMTMLTLGKNKVKVLQENQKQSLATVSLYLR